MPRAHSIRVVQYGLGPIGLECVRTIRTGSRTGRLNLVGAVDIDPDKAGKDVAQLAEMETNSGLAVSADVEAVLEAGKPDVVLHTTVSSLEVAAAQIEPCVRAGAHVISSTEELLFPFERHPELAGKLDQLAQSNGVVILGTGVNPGYVMDTLALMATGVCRDVRRVRVERVVDASARRLPLQRKVGAGMTVEAFEERKRADAIGHVGLRESLLLLAAGLGWKLDRVDETLEPVIAVEDVETEHLRVRAGEVAGIDHRAKGYIGSEPVVELNLEMYVGAEDPHDAVHVDGDPPIDLVIHGGVFGDTATVAVLLNAIPLVLEAKRGLRTMLDLPVPRSFVF